MKIHQLICGEKSKAWDVLKTTLSDTTIAKSIAFVSNLSDEPGGVSWKPVVRAFYHKDYFLLMRTFPDTSPEVRPGRAFSHVLVIKKEYAVEIKDISPLIGLLMDKIDKTFSLEVLDFELSKKLTKTHFTEIPEERFNKIIHGYVRLDNYKNTIIWVGGQGFEEAICKYWQILTASDKEQINVSINFNVSEIPTEKLNLITIPENIESKFLNSGFCVIKRNDKQILNELSEQFLAGDINATRRIKKYEEEIESKPLLRTDIDTIARVISTYENLDSINDIKKIVTLSHVIAEYSPDKKKGVVVKSKLVEKTIRLIETGDITEVTLIRSFKTDSFKDSQMLFTKTVSDWMTKYVFSIAETKKKNISPLFSKLAESSSPNWWTILVKSKLKTFLSEINSETSATIIFNWLQLDFKIFNIIESDIDKSKKAENNIVSQLPLKFDKANLAELRVFAKNRGWYKFHAKLLTKMYSFEKAISEQLIIDKALTSFDGIAIIIEEAKSKSIIDFTVLNGDKRLLKIAGRICNKEPCQLENIDFKNSNWQEIWLESIIIGNTVTDGFNEPRKKIFALFDTITEEYHVNEKLLGKISDTEYGNLLNYPKRENLWGKLSSPIKTKFLAKTSTILLESLSKNSTVDVPTDRTLSDYIIQHAIGDFLYYNSSNLKNVMPVFNKFNQLSENSFRDYISNYDGNLEAIDAVQLGKFIYEKEYKKVASTIYSKANSYNNWKIALAECYSLLDSYTRIFLIWSGLVKNVEISENQWWNSTEEMIIELYPNGTSLKTVWKKAGGKEAELLAHGTATEIWHDAISRLKRGSFTDITMSSLLKEIKKDYDSNEKFKVIYELRKQFI